MTASSSFLALFSLFLLTAPAYSAPSFFGWLERKSDAQDISWGECSMFGIDSQDPNLACGFLEVPMDYHDPNAGNARLAVAKFAATAPQKAGTIFINPGGPGNSGLEIIEQFGQNLSAVFQGTLDVVSWDPRGVGLFTFPGAVTCFDSQPEEDAFFNNTIFVQINHTIAGRFNQQDEDELFAHADESSRVLLEFGKRCQQGPVGNFLQFIGTSSTVRDLVSLGDSIVGKDKPIDYWGFSYGTVIGANFLNMFPERAGHVILDGVVDPTIWVSHKTRRPLLADSEKTYTAFVDGCAASGAAGCRLVELVGDHASGQDIRQLLNDAHDTALALERAGFNQLPISTTEIRGTLHDILQTPIAWSQFANDQAFNLLVLIFQAAQALHIPYNTAYHIPAGTPEPNASSFMSRASGSASNPAQNLTDHAADAIPGADNFVDIENNVKIEDVLNEIVDTTRTVTETFGAVWRLGNIFGWPVRSVERLAPLDFSRLKTPVLVIGNTADPVTAFASAQTTAKLLGDLATLIEQIGVGHTSLAQFSTCTLGIIANFVLASKLPEVPNGDRVQCEIDPINVLFPPIGSSTPAKRSIGPLMRRQ